MKHLGLLVWLTQLGLSVVSPLVAFTLLAIWLHNAFSWERWVIWLGVALGVICAVQGLRDSLRIMGKYVKRDKRKSESPVCFNDHD